MRQTTTARPSPCKPVRLAILLAALIATGVPAIAQEGELAPFRLDVPAPGALPKAKPAVRAKKRPAAAPRPAPARTTIPMDFSGMARRGADLDRPKEGPDPSAPEDRPVIRNGLTPGASFSF